MTTVAAHQRETYSTLWSSVAEYGTHAPGETYVEKFLAMSGALRGDTVLDAGCGTGKGALALQAHGLRPSLCDITRDGLIDEAKPLPFLDACLWDDLSGVAWNGPLDHVYCCDVLEHIPTEFTMLVLARLITPRVCRRGAFFSIALRPDVFGAWVGEPLHLTVQPFTWWRDRMKEFGAIVECRDLIDTGLYYVRPRPRCSS